MSAENAGRSAYAIGRHYASVCTSQTDDEATAQLNVDHPLSRGRRWELSREAFADGKPNGVPCDTDPATNRHLLFERKGR